jgi:site-specific DNA-methyltransferase (adenine-specific)
MLITNEDNMELMSRYPDNYFDLAIVDPPYGVQYARGKNGYGNTTKNLPKLTDVDWDKSTPTVEYWQELFRVSKNQIVWGGNYFALPVSKCWIVWDKIGEMELKNPFADCELAWTSFTKVVKKKTIRQQGFIKDTKDNVRIHPTQKPVKLYEWLLMNYAKEGDKILDTHLGSGSIAIACHNLGYDLTACELDKEYYDAAMKRIEQHKNQQRLF